MPKRIWRRLRQPRTETAIFGGMWIIATAVGTAALTAPPTSITSQIGPILTAAWGTLLLIGGVMGIIGCIILRAEPWWRWTERVAITSAGLGLVIYLYLTAFLQATASGSRLVQIGVICWAGLGLVSRAYLLTRPPALDAPGRVPDGDHS